MKLSLSKVLYPEARDNYPRKETIKASVFRPNLPPPTMTLAEFGDIERENAIARQQQEQQLNDNVVRRYLL